MKLQYISDSHGKTTGVYIPIEEWNELKARYKGIDQEEKIIPDWQVDEVRERNQAYQANPEEAEDFDDALDNIEKDL